MRAHINPLLLNVKAYSESLGSLFRNVLQDAIDVEIDDGPGAFFRLKEGHVLAVIHKEVLCQDSRAACVTDDVEVFLYVGISVGEVGPEAHPRQMVFRGFVQARCQGVGLGLAPGGKAAPALGVEPILAVSGGVNVDGDEKHLIVPEPLADGIYTAAALLQGDVLALRYDELAVQAEGGESFPDQESEIAVVGVFAEVAVRAPFAGSIKAMAIVEKNLHSYHLGSDGKLKIICGNTYFPEIPLTLYQVFHTRSIY